MASEGKGLAVFASGDLIFTGRTTGAGGPTALGVTLNAATMTDELARALGIVVEPKMPLVSNLLADNYTNINEARVALGFGLVPEYEQTLRETAAAVGCAVGETGCPPPPQ